MATPFAITFDYLCPFARNANEAVIEGLGRGSAWEVAFRPFSLAQTKVEEDEPAVWERAAGSDGTRGVLALQWGLAVRDNWSDRFHDYHLALFAARHEHGADIGDAAVLGAIADSVGLDSAAVGAEVESGVPLRTLQAEHGELVEKWAVFGVPTFIANGEAVFVRMMERHRPDEIVRILEMLDWVGLNEFKRTRVPR
jgi:hypothetical protein